MNNYFDELYEEVFEYTCESLTGIMIYDGYYMESDGNGGILFTITEATAKKNPNKRHKKKMTKKDVMRKIRNIVLAITALSLFIRVIKRQIDKIYKKGYEAGFTTGLHDSAEDNYGKGYLHATQVVSFKDYNRGKKDGYDEGVQKGIDKGIKIGRERAGKYNYTVGYDDGRKSGLKAGFKQGVEKGERTGRLTRNKDDYNDGYRTGRKTGIEIGRNKAKAEQINSQPKKGSDKWYVSKMNHAVKDIMNADKRITKKNNGKSVYDGNDILKTLDDYIEVLKEENKKIKEAKNSINEETDRIKSTGNNEDIKDFEAYKDIFSIAKNVKMVSGKIITIADDNNIKVPDSVKEKIKLLDI